ncbi:MAG: hypothetical protein KZY61_08645 [Clostridiaceae bacterium]|nr:hypothetical protein [Clostridiaceae bacterium]MBW4859217.1 hypothetical protein [Clostridiaceae bacterium]MBW4868713.1 hypothetical protein [Clostridiaceae bacterium]
MNAYNILRLFSYVVGFTKEISIIFLIYTAIKTLNIYIKNNKDKKIEQKTESQQDIDVNNAPNTLL